MSLILVLGLAVLVVLLAALHRRERGMAEEASRRLEHLRRRHDRLREGLGAAARDAEEMAARSFRPPKPTRR